MKSLNPKVTEDTKKELKKVHRRNLLQDIARMSKETEKELKKLKGKP